MPKGIPIMSFNKNLRDLPPNFEISEEFEDAFHAMELTDDCIFVTGKAGSGKSTLLKYFTNNTQKQTIVVAPTGIAAVNVSGQTIHSFFKFPPRILQPEAIRRLRNKKIFNQIQTIIIDEVSMVRADLMDAIDYSLRINKGDMVTPFAGVQILMFGDVFQLPPVVQPEEMELLSSRFKSPYFFDATVFTEISLKYLELERIYRQKDEEFLLLLDRIRNNACGRQEMAMLNQRVALPQSKDINCITLTTTNNGARRINDMHISRLPTREYQYNALTEGEFDERSYPTDSCLRLKEGAKVIFVKNDSAGRWVNGTIGTVHLLTEDIIKVDIDGEIYEVPHAVWEKVKYSYNKEDDKIEQTVTGEYEQYPLRLAYAITIHKSQGQTFENVLIDLEYGAFAHGQLYVALSRCTSLEGVYLKRAVSPRDIIFDERIIQYCDKFDRLEIRGQRFEGKGCGV